MGLDVLGNLSVSDELIAWEDPLISSDPLSWEIRPGIVQLFMTVSVLVSSQRRPSVLSQDIRGENPRISIESPDS